MEYIFIGMVAGSLVISSHTSREACEGRTVLAREKGVSGKCIGMPAGSTVLSAPSGSFIPAGPTSQPAR